jgi:hypothetical protein
MRHVIDNSKLKGKLGGKRPGAGRKPDYLKRLGVTPVNAAQILERYDPHVFWGWFLKHPNPKIRLEAAQYLTDRRDGKPRQAVDVSGTLNHAAVPYRDPRLAGLSDDELATLDGLTRKLLPAAPDVPRNQPESASPEDQKRETTFPVAIANGLRTPLPGGPVIEIPATEQDSPE